MNTALWISASCGIAFVLSGCGNSSNSGGGSRAGTQQPGIGPFDSQGRYREEWADNPSQWRKPDSPAPRMDKTDSLTAVAQNDQPPMNSIPLPPTQVNRTTPARVESRTASRPVTKTTTPAVVKAKPKVVAKPKPKSTRYVVKKGDTLSAIASRNGSSVSAIQRANGISGSMIQPGQSLAIPK
jgi:nucleoid-associated protein YgaU